jgi:hypothetical protein
MKFYLALLIFLGGGGRIYAQEPSRLEKGNQLYEDSRIPESITEYEALVREHPNVPEYHYNLGNAYFRLNAPGALGKSISAYQKAFSLNPRDPDIRFNYDFALRRAGERLIAPGTPAGLHVLFYALSTPELAGLQWLGFWAALFLGAFYMLNESRQSKIRPWLISATFYWGIFAMWWGLRFSSEDRSPGVIIVQDAEVRSGPGANFPVSFKLPEGRRISKLDRKGDWIEIGVKLEGLKGWIDASALNSIK